MYQQGYKYSELIMMTIINTYNHITCLNCLHPHSLNHQVLLHHLEKAQDHSPPQQGHFLQQGYIIKHDDITRCNHNTYSKLERFLLK